MSIGSGKIPHESTRFMARTPQWPPINERRNRGGSVSFVLECGFQPKAGGGRKRIRIYKKTQQDADNLGRELRLVRKEQGLKAAQARAAALTGLQEYLPKLHARGLTVKDAVLRALQMELDSSPNSVSPTSEKVAMEPLTIPGRISSKSPTVAEVIDEFIAARVEAKKGEAPSEHEEIMRLVLRKALKEYLEKPIQGIGLTEITTALRATKTRATRGNWISNLNNLFAYASAPGIDYVRFNPVPSVVKSTTYGPAGSGDMDVNVEEVVVLSLQDVIRLLRYVEQVPEYHCMVLPLALQIFYGLRRVEVRRLSRDELLRKVGEEMSVKAKRTRSRMNRWVAVNKTIYDWITRWFREGQDIYPEKYPEILRRIVRELKLKWVRNILRHTFASNYYRVHGEAKTVEAMGHAIPDTTFKFYLRKITKADAGQFWAIQPSAPVEIDPQNPTQDAGFYTLAQVLERQGEKVSRQFPSKYVPAASTVSTGLGFILNPLR